MIETLTNLKNNKIKKSATQHQGGDTVERMKKFLSGLGKKRHGELYSTMFLLANDTTVSQYKRMRHSGYHWVTSVPQKQRVNGG